MFLKSKNETPDVRAGKAIVIIIYWCILQKKQPTMTGHCWLFVSWCHCHAVCQWLSTFL